MPLSLFDPIVDTETDWRAAAHLLGGTLSLFDPIVDTETIRSGVIPAGTSNFEPIRSNCGY